MPTLHFGVVDLPYASSSYERAPKGSKKFRHGAPKAATRDVTGSNQKTTGDVAEILEERYHVMEQFYLVLGAEVIAKSLERSLEDGIKDIQGGAPTKGLSVTLAAEQELQTAFQIFIDQQEMDSLPPLGVWKVPTAASLKGVNHRLMHPYAKGNPARPSFRDTGLYESAFRAWLSE